MKKIITTVGTSLFSNLVNQDSNYQDLKDKLHEEWGLNQSEIEEIKNKLLKKLKNKSDSAELQSIAKIKEELKDNLEIYLLATDTILSRLACELLQLKLPEIVNNNLVVHFNHKFDVIKGLQVKNRKNFEKEGLINLLNRIETIANGYWGNLIFNITGGYKAVIPYMTILAQVHSLTSYYTFEESKFELLRIPNLPLSINEAIFEKYWAEFEKLEAEDTLTKKSFSDNFLKEAESCLEIEEDLVCLNPLGVFLWRKYKEKFFFFYSPEEVFTEIQKQPNIQRILKTKDLVSKTQKKGDHFVYDDGDNTNRIFYFEEKGRIYIYKTFERNHDDYEKFISTPLNKTAIVQNSKPRKEKIKEVNYV
ncbi:MAG: hypothetical protein N3A69_11965 [Leptospiraceae bacterium]|nr:hypothetical protein [Leptospiraceae bacterium]